MTEYKVVTYDELQDDEQYYLSMIVEDNEHNTKRKLIGHNDEAIAIFVDTIDQALSLSGIRVKRLMDNIGGFEPIKAC